MKNLFITFMLLSIHFATFAQDGWTFINTPNGSSRIDDICMPSALIGYAVGGSSKIMKTVDGGESWAVINNSNLYCRSVRFINTQKGFVGGFSNTPNTPNILRKTEDGGTTWTDLTPLLHPKTRGGICGLAVADSNTVYGCGNWFQDSAYIVKSSDGGNTWTYIDMSAYAGSLIDMNFTSKDTGFVVGRGLRPLQTAIILYTTDGGNTWTYKYQNTVANEYTWKIQRLSRKLYFASIEDMTSTPPSILKSVDGGMTWTKHFVSNNSYNIEGVGFIDSLRGWTGGGNYAFKTIDGGITWTTLNICPQMNRVIRINDSLVFASGYHIWKYQPLQTVATTTTAPALEYISLNCSPNPAHDRVNIKIDFFVDTRSLLLLLDAQGKTLKVIENAHKNNGRYDSILETDSLPNGVYYIVLKTHEAKKIQKIIINH